MTYIKPVRGCRECHAFARQLRFTSEELGNAKMKFHRAPSEHAQQTLIDLKAVVDTAREAFADHLVDHPPAAPRREPPARPLAVIEATTTETRTETYRIANGELRDFPGSTVAGRKYQVETVTITTERRDSEWSPPTIDLAGPVIKADGTPGGGRRGRETLTEQEAPEWLTTVLADPNRAA